MINKNNYLKLKKLGVGFMKNVYKLMTRALILTALFCIMQNNASAESDLTKNKEFILTFLPNYQSYGGDSIFIFIYAEVPTKGKINYRDRKNNLFEEDFDIPDPNVVYIFKKPAWNFALLGFSDGGHISEYPKLIDTEKIRDFSFRVTADNSVQVYGHSQSYLTSESFNVLPIESLGDEYLVLSYNAQSDIKEEIGSDYRTPSQFAVVAVEDSTIVTITPSAATYFNGTKIQTITLNAGQVYLVQTSLAPNNPDLSGSIVLSDKPVAVFSGHQRAMIPVDSLEGQVTRDYLAEQMTPVGSWSNEVVVAPFPSPAKMDSTKNASDIFRVIAAFDNTQLMVDGALIAELNRGEIYEEALTSPKHIKANNLIMAAGYKRSSSLTKSDTSFRGDPLMQIIPTTNQYSNSYRFITIQRNFRLKNEQETV